MSNPSSGLDEAYGVVIDGSALYVVGEDSALGSFNWRIEKRSLSDGSLIRNVTSHPQGQNTAYGVAVDNSGIYVVGESQTHEGVGTEWRTEKRRLTDGSLIWNATTHPLGEHGDDSAQSVVVDATGVYVVGGQRSPMGGFVWRVEKRGLADGSLMWNVTSHPTPDQWAWGAAVDASGIYMVGYDRSPDNDDEWRVEKRHLSDGSLVWDVTSNPSPKTNQAKGVAVDGSGVYVVGFDMSPNNFQWRIEKRHLADGSLVWNATSKPTSGAAEAHAVAAGASGIYVAGYDSSTNPDVHEWRIEKRELGPPVPPPAPNAGAILLIAAAVPVGIASLASAAILLKRTAYPAGLPRRTQRRPAMTCLRCGRPLSYHVLYRRWYCSSCRTYV